MSGCAKSRRHDAGSPNLLFVKEPERQSGNIKHPIKEN